MTQEDKEIIMTSITEDYVSFETAKLLKENGFNSKCIAYYLVFNENIKFYECNNLGQSLPYISNDNWTIILRNPLESGYTAPTLQMVMKWLREVHNLYIDIRININNSLYSFKIYSVGISGARAFTEYRIKSYESACEEAIKYCLKHLI